LEEKKPRRVKENWWGTTGHAPKKGSAENQGSLPTPLSRGRIAVSTNARENLQKINGLRLEEAELSFFGGSEEREMPD